MAIQLQYRNRFGSETKWFCDGETNRREPTRAMKEARGWIRQNPDNETRYVYDRAEFV